MAVNLNTIAEKIMKFIRGNGLAVKMFDSESGKSVADPSLARFFYIDEPNMMVVLDDNEATIKFHLGEGVSINDPVIAKMRKNLKAMANEHILDFDIRSFGQRIEPKGYGYKIEQNKERDVDEVYESISRLEGSTRTSRQKLENAKIIVRHKKPVNEEQRGARSRNISAIFIENADGERFKYPFKHLSGARAMARHISTGGNPMDMAGSAIIEMSENLSKLKEFMSVVNKQQLVNETNRDVVMNVKHKIKKIKEQIAHIQGAKGYTAFIESLALNETSEEAEISEDTINSYVSKFTKTTFEESLKDILPLIHKVNEEEYNSNRDGQIEKVMSIITAKDAEGNKINTISFPNKSSYDFDNIKKQYKDDKGSQYAKVAAAYEDLASRVDVDSTDDKVRKNKGHDRAAIISLFLADIAEKLNSNPKAITKPEQQLASYFMKMSQRPAVGESLEEKKSLDEKLDNMVVETFAEFNDVFEEYQVDERKLTGGEKRSREANVKKLKKHKGDFEDTYGKDKGEQVMYAVATKRAKNESVEQIEEISLDKLDKYNKSASAEYQKAINTSNKLKKSKGVDSDVDTAIDTAIKKHDATKSRRGKGIGMARQKMADKGRNMTGYTPRKK